MYDENPTHRPPLTGYRGRYAHRHAIVERLPDRTRLSPARSRTLRTHSRGFEWGYAGSGPSQLGLAILLDYTRDEAVALDYYQAFTREVITGLDGTWELSTAEIDTVLRALGVTTPNRVTSRTAQERLDG
ncbi:DUF6166 domain-containing protein [Salinirubrum litoreum]|uniref:DUF6166 domain-containing protein n=1 Tax=Salinirubrum litoreum TaxID=1126234 RepID=A0ABD5RFK0_9EURY|nr:DUF6166 domain-containing protein [Salinirubrum litoreum]